jgi:predicted enzyme related to lactoylglutathione lyase
VVVKIDKVMLGFQKVADPTPGKNRLHLDLHVDTDLDATVRELLAAGATLVGDRGDESFRWITLADPQGNQFCVAGGE